MLVVALFLLSMIGFLIVTKIDLFKNLNHPATSGMVYTSTAMLFLAVCFIYMIVNRAFAGYTPGEWAFDQFCGEPKQTTTLMYIPRLILRTLIVMGTGFVTLPLLSYIYNTDIAGQLSGVNLLRKPNA